MLYDPKWEVKVVEPFKLTSLIAWLEKQSADGRYDYCSNGECMLAQYFSAAGYRHVQMNPDSFHHAGRDFPVMLPRGFNAVAQLGRKRFGAALERARAIL